MKPGFANVWISSEAIYCMATIYIQMFYILYTPGKNEPLAYFTFIVFMEYSIQ